MAKLKYYNGTSWVTAGELVSEVGENDKDKYLHSNLLTGATEWVSLTFGQPMYKHDIILKGGNNYLSFTIYSTKASYTMVKFLLADIYGSFSASSAHASSIPMIYCEGGSYSSKKIALLNHSLYSFSSNTLGIEYSEYTSFAINRNANSFSGVNFTDGYFYLNNVSIYSDNATLLG